MKITLRDQDKEVQNTKTQISEVESQIEELKKPKSEG